MFKKLFCKHDFHRIWMESGWWSGVPGTNGLETWLCECSKCKKKKFVVFEIDEKGCYHEKNI